MLQAGDGRGRAVRHSRDKAQDSTFPMLTVSEQPPCAAVRLATKLLMAIELVVWATPLSHLGCVRHLGLRRECAPDRFVQRIGAERFRQHGRMANDQWAKEQLQQWNDLYGLFTDVSVDTNDVDDDLPTERIRCIIRDDYLRDSTVTIVLIGTETKGRKHVDWEV